MRYLAALWLLAAALPVRAQAYNAALLDTLAVISKTGTPAKHFARLYYNAIAATNNYLAEQPANVRDFICGFEASFAPEFFKASNNFNTHSIQSFYWQQYFADTTLNELQYCFIGMAAHINGDFGMALKNTYSYDTIQYYRRPLLRFQKVLNVFFDSMYAQSGRYKKLKRLRMYTLGADKLIGRNFILHWRRRQVSLALCYYTNPVKYARKNKRTQHTMLKWKKFALTWIK